MSDAPHGEPGGQRRTAARLSSSHMENATMSTGSLRRARRIAKGAIVGAFVLLGLIVVQGCGPKYGGPPPGDGDNTDKEPPPPPGEKK